MHDPVGPRHTRTPVVLLALVLTAAAGAVGLELVPDGKTGLFTIAEDSAPLVKAHYIGWGANWKWDGPQVRMGERRGDAHPFTLRFNRLDVDAEGSWQAVTPNRLTWSYELTFNADQSDVIGAGIEFNLELHSPVRAGAATVPALLEGHRGWSWEARPGRTVRISFEPPLPNVYFERGQKQRIRTMFFGKQLQQGEAQLTMTVALPEDGTVARSPAERYGPADVDTWFEQALDPHESFIDLSHLNKKPAGAHGFVRAVGDRFEFEDGTPVRFWGCNVQAYSLFVTNRELVKRHAQRTARLGFNLVRLHHHDSAQWVRQCLIAEGSTSQQLNEEALDAYFWWIKCLRDEGIYIWVDLLVGRPFREGDEIPGWSDLAKHARERGAEAKGFTYLNPRLRELLKQFNGQLLTRVNPHTGLALKGDPAVMGLLITNENELTNHFGNTFLADKGHPYHQALFEKKRDAFAQEHDLDRNTVWQTWVPGPSKLLLNHLEAEFDRDMIAHLRSLGVRAPVATCHMWGGNPLFSLPALTTGEIIDAHTYSQGEFLRSNPHYVANFIHWLGQAQVVGKPLAVTEYNMEDRMSFNDAFTVPLYVGAMAAFQGWDAPMLYGYSQDALRGAVTSAWSSYMHPAIMGLMPAAAVMYRQDHVQAARETVVLAPPAAAFYGVAHSPRSSAAIRTALEQHRLVVAMPRTKELPWLVPSPIPPGATVVIDPGQDLLEPGTAVIESDTGEIRRDWGRGIQTIDTPKSQAAIGWLGGRTVKLGDTAFRITTPKAAVVLTSLDGQPLRTSERILLSTAARVRSVTTGGPRHFRSEPVAGTVALRSAVSGLRLLPLRPDGTYAPAIALRRERASVRIDLPTDAGTHWFLLTP